MPQQVKMVISNGNHYSNFLQSQMKTVSVSNKALAVSVPKATPSSLRAPIISRIHNVQPGCGSCGKH